jgi:hypothetical protein
MVSLRIEDAAPPSAPTARVFAAAAITGALVSVGLVMHWSGVDLAAQVFRADLVRQYGFVLWDSRWYGGHATLDYSLLSPLLGALIGPLTLGALSCVASAVLFDRIVARGFGRASLLGSLWFAVGAATNLAVGRITFALGAAFALGAILCLQHRHAVLGGVAAAASSLASPITGVFVAIACAAWFLARRDARTQATVVALGAVLPLLAIALLFPGGGYFPYEGWAYVWDMAVCGLCFACAWQAPLALRWGIALYAFAATVAYLVSSPLGQNISRLGQYTAGPVLACLLWQRRRWLLIAVALPLLWWQWYPAFDGIGSGRHDVSSHASYYQPVLEYLHAHDLDGRIEVLPTYRHWESVYLATEVPIARGWQRQLDMAYDKLFYDNTLSATTYDTWLDDNAVQYVAVPDARLDDFAVAERALVLDGLPYLRPVLHTAHWQLYRVTDFRGMVSGPATLVSSGVSSLTIDVHAAGDLVVRVRPSPRWALNQDDACVARTADGWVRVEHAQPGRLVLRQALVGSGCSS